MAVTDLAMSEEEPISTNQEAPEKSFFGVIIHSFFIIPFLIAVLGVLLFFAVRLLTMEPRTAYDYLNDVKTGSLTKRWQSAFELSKLMANFESLSKDERFVSELMSAFEHSKHDDNRVRQYLALAMGRTANARFVPALVSALKDEKEENLYALIYALGLLRDHSATSAIEPYLEDPQPYIRLASVIALGDIGDPRAIGSLKKSLGDSEANVQWDAAIALAKLHDPSGKGILSKLLHREYLVQFSTVDSKERNHILMVAVQAAYFLNDPQLNNEIAFLAEKDQNMEVRKVASAVLKTKK